MRRLTTIEKSAVALGVVFVVIGAYMTVHPAEGFVFHPGYKYRTGTNQPEHVSKSGSQIYGGLAVVMGCGICWLAFYRDKS
jgi:uncharacterized protein YjeT (DUF2065 family)